MEQFEQYYRLPQDVLDRDIDHILTAGVKVHTGVSIGKDLSIENICGSFDAVYIAIGIDLDGRKDVLGMW